MDKKYVVIARGEGVISGINGTLMTKEDAVELAKANGQYRVYKVFDIKSRHSGHLVKIEWGRSGDGGSTYTTKLVGSEKDILPLVAEYQAEELRVPKRKDDKPFWFRFSNTKVWYKID